MIHGAKIHIQGNAGWFAADNMTDGEVIIEGSAGDGVGQGIYGGVVVVKKDVGSRTGEIMKNGTIIIGGSSGFMSGLFMMGGRIIVMGDISEDAGESIIRGTIYVGGEIKSLGKNAKIEQLEQEEIKELKDLLPVYGFNLNESQFKKFRKIVPRSKRPFYGKETEEG
jgi:glutamate synthase domain-containing protein 3